MTTILLHLDPWTVLAAIVAVQLLAFALLRASERHCPTCVRSWAIWPARGRLNRWVLLCRPCWRSHRRRRLAAR